MSRARTFPHSVRYFAAQVLALLASLVLAGAAAATTVPPPPSEERYGDKNIAAALYADGAPQAGREWLLALRFTPSAPEWHGYWSNPGDAGQGMRVVLDLPPGWELGEARYPVPKRLVISGLMNHIYEGPYTVLLPVKVPAGADVSAAARVTGHVEFLACTDQICVPQDALLTARQGGDLARWRAEVAPLLDARGAFAIAGQTLRVAIPLPAGVALPDPHLFIGQTKIAEMLDADFAGAQIVRRAGDMVVFEIPLKPLPPLPDGIAAPPHPRKKGCP